MYTNPRVCESELSGVSKESGVKDRAFFWSLFHLSLAVRAFTVAIKHSMADAKKRKIVFNDDGDAVEMEVKDPSLRIKPKNTAEDFEALKATMPAKRKRVKEEGKVKEKRVKAAFKEKSPAEARQDRVPKEKKPLPPGYVCKACGAADEHAIYDCPLHKKQKQKKKKGPEADDSKEDEGDEEEKGKKETLVCYIDGLKFNTDVARMLMILAEKECVGVAPKGVTIVPFPDNKEKCKFVLVAFASLDDSRRCVEQLHGQRIDDRLVRAYFYSPKVQQKDGGGDKAKYKSKGKFKSGADKMAAKRCYRCGGEHDPATCNEARVCYRCRSTEHLSSACPLRKNPTRPSEAGAGTGVEGEGEGKRRKKKEKEWEGY